MTKLLTLILIYKVSEFKEINLFFLSTMKINKI